MQVIWKGLLIRFFFRHCWNPLKIFFEFCKSSAAKNLDNKALWLQGLKLKLRTLKNNTYVFWCGLSFDWYFQHLNILCNVSEYLRSLIASFFFFSNVGTGNTSWRDVRKFSGLRLENSFLWGWHFPEHFPMEIPSVLHSPIIRNNSHISIPKVKTSEYSVKYLSLPSHWHSGPHKTTGSISFNVESSFVSWWYRWPLALVDFIFKLNPKSPTLQFIFSGLTVLTELFFTAISFHFFASYFKIKNVRFLDFDGS